MPRTGTANMEDMNHYHENFLAPDLIYRPQASAYLSMMLH
jgi:hypothetical protein